MKESRVTKLGIIPIGQQFIEELGISELIDSHIESGKEEISHGKVVNVLLLNLLDNVCPLYKVSDWLGNYTDGIGNFAIEASKFHDKRLGSTLDAIYKSNRHTILSELSGRVIARHEIATDIIHNDTTSVTFTGAYKQNQAVGSEIVLTQGYNKDHRPDCKQIVFGLNVSADGYVPLMGQLYSGNKSDDQTHQVNWQALRELLNRVDFIYIADSKLSTTENLLYIAGAGGFFISILPATRKEVKDFYKELAEIGRTNCGVLPCEWPEVYRKENSRKQGEFIIYRIKENQQTKEGFRLLWVHSSAKAEQDEKRRQAKLERGVQFLEELQPKLNHYYLKTEEQILYSIEKGLGKSLQLFDIQIIAREQIVKKQKGRGRPGVNTEWEKQTIISYELVYSINQLAVKIAATKDGIFPLVTNTKIEPVEVLKNYKNQPYLEKRFNTLKSVLEVAPVFLKMPHRVEAMLFLYLIALMLIALIERRIRKNMEAQKITALPILPQGMKTKKPTWSNIKFCFNRIIMLSVLFGNQEDWQRQIKGIGKNQQAVLQLLEVEESKYQKMSPDWWKTITTRGG